MLFKGKLALTLEPAELLVEIPKKTLSMGNGSIDKVAPYKTGGWLPYIKPPTAILIAVAGFSSKNFAYHLKNFSLSHEFADLHVVFISSVNLYKSADPSRVKHFIYTNNHD